MPRGNGATVNHDRRPVEAPHGHQGTRHVFIASGDGNQSVIILATADGFDAIGDDIAAHQRIAHAICAVSHAVAYTDGVEHQADEVVSPNALFYHFGQVIKVHIARIAIIAHAGDPDLCLLHVFIGKPNAVKHSLCSWLCFVLGKDFTVFV